MQTTLDKDQLRRFAEQGYLHVPGAVTEQARATAIRTVYATLADREGLDPEWLEAYRRVSFVPELRQDPALTGLVTAGPVAAMLEDLLRPDGPLIHRAPQVKILFPTAEPDDPEQAPVPGLDGIIAPSGPFPAGRIDNYTGSLLIGLGGGAVPDATVVVWPGSHQAYAAHLATVGAEALLAGPPALDLGTPERVRLAAGDLLVLHYLTARAVEPNRAADVGVYVRFEFDVQGHDSVWWKDGFHWADLTDVWHDWQGVAAELPAPARQ